MISALDKEMFPTRFMGLELYNKGLVRGVNKRED